jgi:hypothetical protein
MCNELARLLYLSSLILIPTVEVYARGPNVILNLALLGFTTHSTELLPAVLLICTSPTSGCLAVIWVPVEDKSGLVNNERSWRADPCRGVPNRAEICAPSSPLVGSLEDCEYVVQMLSQIDLSKSASRSC